MITAPAQDLTTPLTRGYRNPAQLKPLIAQAHRTNLKRSVGMAVFDAGSLMAIIAIANLALQSSVSLIVKLATALIAVGFAARQLRALECMVHEGSHFNWSRENKKMNDFLTAFIAGFPTGASLSQYRTSHLLHHGKFGTLLDPDRLRYKELQLEDLPRNSLISFILAIFRRLPAYQRGWLKEASGEKRLLLMPIYWATIFITIPGYLLGGLLGSIGSTALWFCAFGGALPVIRIIAESNEHRYRAGTTVFTATISNLGVLHRLIFHPHGDGYHTVHHLWPGVPHHQLAHLHQQLLLLDDFYAANLYVRTHILSQPQPLGLQQISVPSQN